MSWYRRLCGGATDHIACRVVARGVTVNGAAVATAALPGCGCSRWTTIAIIGEGIACQSRACAGEVIDATEFCLCIRAQRCQIGRSRCVVAQTCERSCGAVIGLREGVACTASYGGLGRRRLVGIVVGQRFLIQREGGKGQASSCCCHLQTLGNGATSLVILEVLSDIALRVVG